MPIAYENALSFFAALASMAEELRQTILESNDLERLRLITEVVTKRDMVFGVWPDEGGDGGFGVQIIKGEGEMPPLVGFERERAVSIGAIPCAGFSQAVAARDVWASREEARRQMEEAVEAGCCPTD